MTGWCRWEALQTLACHSSCVTLSVSPSVNDTNLTVLLSSLKMLSTVPYLQKEGESYNRFPKLLSLQTRHTSEPLRLEAGVGRGLRRRARPHQPLSSLTVFLCISPTQTSSFVPTFFFF